MPSKNPSQGCPAHPTRATRRLRALVVAAIAGLALVAGFSALLNESSARAATATVDLRIVAPGQPGLGFEELSTDSFAAAEAQILGLSSGTGIALAWPEVDPSNALTAFGLGTTQMTSYPASQTIVFERSAATVSFGGQSLSALAVVDWTPGEADPTISLGLRGSLNVATDDTALTIDGALTLATGVQEIEVSQAINFHGTDAKLQPGVSIAGVTNIGNQLGDFANDEPDFVRNAEIAGSIDTSVAKLLNDGTINTNTSFDLSATIGSFGLQLPAGITSTQWSFSIAYNQPTDALTVGGSAALTLDAPVLGAGELAFDAAVDITIGGPDDGEVNLSGAYSGDSPFEPFDLGVGVTGVELALNIPGGGATPTITIGGRLVVDGVRLEMSATVGAAVAASLFVDDVSLGTLADTIGGAGSTLPTLPEPVRRVRIVNTAIGFEINEENQLAASFQSSVVLRLEGTDRTIGLFVEFDETDAIFALELPDGLTIGDITSASLESAFSSIPIPSGSIIISGNDIARSELSDNAATALAPLYCAAADLACDFEVTSGIGFTAGIRFPDLDDALQELWVAPGSEFRVTGQFPVFGGGGSFSLAAQLPTLQPPATAPESEWFKSANLGISITKDGADLSFELAGDMRVQFPDEPAPITFFASAAMSISPTEVSFTLTGGVEGWVDPFGLDWLFLENATAEIKVFTGVRSGVQLGVRTKVRIGGTDNGNGTMSGGTVLDGSIAFGVNTPAPTPCNCSIDFGIRIFASSLTRDDLVAVANQFGASVDASTLPDFAVKNAEFSFSTIESEALCLRRGFIIGGDIHLGGGASTVSSNDADRDLSSCGGERTSESAGQTRCSSEASCLVHLRLEVTDQGIIAEAELGDYGLGPITVGDASVALRLTSAEQSFQIGGRIGVDGFVAVEGEVRLSTDGFSFFITTEDADGDERWTIAASAGVDNGKPTSFSLQVSVKSELFADFSEGLSGFVADAADFFTAGDANLDVIRVRCFTFTAQIGGVNPDGIDTNGSINGRINWTATPNQGGTTRSLSFALGWDFDETVASNLAAFTSATPQTDTTGCGEPPVGTVFGLDNGTGVPGANNLGRVDQTAFLAGITTFPQVWNYEMLTGQLVDDPGVFAVRNGEQITLAAAFRADEQASYQVVFRVPGRNAPVVRNVGIVTEGELGYAEFTSTGSLPADSDWIQGVATAEIRVTGTTEPIVTESLPFSLYRDGVTDIDIRIPATVTEGRRVQFDAEFDLPPAPLDIRWRYEVNGVPFTIELGRNLDPYLNDTTAVGVNSDFPSTWQRRFSTVGATNTNGNQVPRPFIELSDDGTAVITLIIETAAGTELGRTTESMIVVEDPLRPTSIRFDNGPVNVPHGLNSWPAQPILTTADLTFEIDYGANDYEGDGPWTFVTSTSDGATTSTVVSTSFPGGISDLVFVENVQHTLLGVPVGLVEFNATMFDKDGNAAATYTRDVLVVPPNDELANATQFSGVGSVTGTTARATHGGASEIAFGTSEMCMVWYSWTPPSTGTFLVEVASTRVSDGSELYTTIIERTSGDLGDSLFGLTVDATDLSPIELGVFTTGNACDPASGAIDPAKTGPFELTVRSAPPIQDDFIGGISGLNQIVVDSPKVEVNTQNATAEPGEPAFSPTQPARKTVWLTVDLDPFDIRFDGYSDFLAGGRLRITTEGSDFDTVMSVYVESEAGTGVDGATLIARNDDIAAPLRHSAVEFELHDYVDRTRDFAQRILVQVDGFNGASGNLDLTAEFLPPVNDTPATATDVALGAGTNPSITVGQNFKATDDNNNLFNGVWYRYEAREDALIVSDATGGEVVAYRDGSNLTEVSDQPIRALAGETYFFEVSSNNLDNVRFEFSLGRAPLANDNRADAPQLFNAVTTSNVGATLEPGEPNHAGRPVGASIWYRIQPVSLDVNARFDPATATPMTFTTSNSTFDTVLALYREGPDGELIEVASNDDFGGTLDSQIRIDVGNDLTTYWAAVSGYNGAEGFTDFSLGGPSNNLLRIDRTRFIGGYARSGADFQGEMSREPGEPDPSCTFAGDPTQNSRWWVWKAPSNDTIDIDTRHSNDYSGDPTAGLDTQLAIYTEDNGVLTEVACNEDIDEDAFVYESYIRFEPTAGTEYYIQLDTFAGADGRARLVLSPSGDYVENANELTGPSDFEVRPNNFATGALGSGENFNLDEIITECFPERPFSEDLHGLWWTWTAPSAGQFTFNTIGSTADTVLGVWDGDPVQGADTCNNDTAGLAGGAASVEVTAAAGQRFTIQVDTIDGTGDIHLAVNPTGATLCKGVSVTVDIGAGESPTTESDVIVGTSGDDFIDALGGDDVVCAGAGRDMVLGGAGNDFLYGEADNDELFGDADDDTVQGDGGDADRCFLGTGDDTEGIGCETTDDDRDCSTLGDVCNPDDDNDTVLDIDDNCQTISNTNQANQDGDALGDACDPDVDGDNAPNDTDNCRTTPNPNQADVDGDGAGDACDATDDRPVDPPTPPIDPPVATPAAFSPLSPSRFADTRANGETIDDLFRGDGAVAGGTFYEIEIAGRGDVPESASAATLNITSVRSVAKGFLTVYPCGDRPNASSVNYEQGANTPNEVVAKLSPSGTVCVFSRSTTDLLVDVVAYSTSGSAYTPLTPARIADTRPGAGETVDDLSAGDGAIGSGQFYEVQVSGRGGVSDTARTATLNITSVGSQGKGFLTVWPCGDRPNASALNYQTGVNTANEVITKLSSTGSVCVFSSQTTNLLIDVVGQLEGPGSFTSVSPARLADTRAGNGETADGRFAQRGTIGAGDFYEVQISGRGGVDDNATTAIINITSVRPATRGFFTVWPCDTKPNASALNFETGQNRANEIIAKLSPTGAVCVFTNTDAELLIDVVGFA